MFSHISSHKYSRIVNKRVEKVSSTLSAALWEGFLVGARCRMSQVGHTRLSKQSPSRGLNGRHWPADTPDLEQYTEVNDEVH